MTKEDKDLLYRYLCMALPYGVKCRQFKLDSQICTLTADLLNSVNNLEPFLRPMSSMTKEENEQRIQLGIWRSSRLGGYCEVTRIDPDVSEYCNSQAFQNALIFLLGEHFDIFGLIPKGLAIEVTAENNPYN